MKLDGKSIILIALVGGAIWYFTTQSKRVDIGSATISKLKLEGANLRINVNLPIINRSDFSVPISGFLGSLLYNSVPIGTTQLVTPTTLQSRGQMSLEFTTVVSIISVITSTPLLTMLAALAKRFLNVSLPNIPVVKPLSPDKLSNELKLLRINGTLYVGGLGIDINQPLTA
jgi:hypothetical protein